MMRLVERHGKIRRSSRRRPRCNGLASLPIDEHYFLRIGQIHKDTRSRLLQLKRFRVRIELDIADLIAVDRINDAESTAAISNIDAPRSSIVTNIVGVVGKFYRCDALERRAVEDVAGTALAVGDENLVELRDETNALRLIKTADALKMLARAKIQDFDRIVSQRGDKKSLAFNVDRHVIDAPLHIWQGDRW